MQNLSKIRALLIFLRSGKPSLDDILKFVALDTLYDFSAISVHLNVVQSDGTIHISANFGCDPSILAQVPIRMVSTDTLFNRYLRTGVIGECGSFDDFTFSGPGFPDQLFPEGFESSFSLPLQGVGALAVFCSKKIDLGVDGSEFLMIIGSILSFEILRVRRAQLTGSYAQSGDYVAEFSMTPFQWKILERLRQGISNSEISQELGRSESFVREESVKIYRILGVSGRNEVLARSTEFRFAKNDS